MDAVSAAALAAYQTQSNADHIWVLVATALVLFMQAGFLLLEAGSTRSKNSISVAQKNLVDLFMSVGAFFLIGFSLMFGTSHGWIGWSPGLASFAREETWTLAFFAFQAVFAGTAATIMSGAVAERMRFGAYLVIATVLAGFLYPVFGHWAWGNLLDPANTAWLAERGFMDFAGSTVVHSAGGWCALAVIIVLGPRIGRFGADRRPREMNGHSLVLSTAGAIILLFGWFGFNAGSTVAATADVAMVLANTLIAAVFGGMAGTLVGRVMDGLYMPMRGVNGLLGALVGITAGCAYVDLHGAMWIGLICGTLVTLAEEALLRRARLDDVVGAVAVHGVGGLLGTLLLAVFARPDLMVAPTRMAQLAVQAQGAALAFGWFFGMSLLLAAGLKAAGLLRVSEDDEVRGLNMAEHGVQMSTGALQEALTRLAMVERDLTQRLHSQGGDEASEIAAVLNPFLSDMQRSLQSVKSHAADVSATSGTLLSLSRDSMQDATLLSSASAQMLSSAEQLDSSAGHARETVGDVAQQAEMLAEKASNMASDMADLTETVRDMAVTVHEISGDVRHASDASRQAEQVARGSLETIGTLAETSEAVNEVLTRIREIADKTILLALNARVEAARSGEAGRGFAIVAQEVAELSRQTQEAADLITQRITQMRSGSLDALGGMRSVAAVLAGLVSDMGNVSTATSRQGEAIASLEAVAETGTRMAEDVRQGADVLRAGTRQMQDFTEEVSQGSTETRKIAQDLTASATRGQKHADRLSLSSVTLARDAERLSAAARRYKS